MMMRRRQAIVVAVLMVLAGASTASATGTATWSRQPVPAPSKASATTLDGVSCQSTDLCMAVGSYRPSARPAAEVSTAAMWDGTSWTSLSTPKLGSGASELDVLESVSCAEACVAVGYRGGTPVAERLDGSSWTLQTTPDLRDARLASVSCTSSNACTAVGHTTDASGHHWETLAERWDGRTWTVQQTPSFSTGEHLLTGVSCSAAPSSCIAVGYYTPHTAGHSPRALAERWNGSDWTVMTTPAFKTAPNTELQSVSCPSSEACTAVGYHWSGRSGPGSTTRAEQDHGVAERWNGKQWTFQKLPSQPRGRHTSDFPASRVTAPRACTAVGQYRKGGAGSWTLAERWRHHWSMEHTRNPAKGSKSTLVGVDCPKTMVCTAVGEWGTLQSQGAVPAQGPAGRAVFVGLGLAHIRYSRSRRRVNAA